MHEQSPMTMTLDTIWESYEKALKEFVPEERVRELAKICFFNGADSIIRLVILSSMQGADAFRDTVQRSAASCQFVLGNLDTEEAPESPAEVN